MFGRSFDMKRVANIIVVVVCFFGLAFPVRLFGAAMIFKI
jgi:hypothetical protein